MNFDYIATTLMMIIFKVLGLAPFAVKKTPESKLPKSTRRDNVNIEFSLSRLGSFYNLLLIAVQLRLLILAIPTIYSDDYPGKSTTTETIDLLATVLGNSVVIAIYLLLGFQQKAAVSLLNRLFSLRDGILDHNDKETCESCRNYFFLMFLTNIVLFTALQTIDYLAYKPSTIAIFRIDWPDAIMTWFITQYIFVIKYMYYRVRYLNRRLVDCPAATLSVDTRRLCVVRDASLNDSLLSNVANLRRVHDDLYQIASEVAGFYSLPILFAITHLVIVVVYSAYYLIIPFVLRNNSHSTLMIVHSVAHIICTMLPIVVLALEVTRFTAEMNTTVDMVDKLLVFSDINEHDRIELRQFALVLMHRKVRFTANGLFSLDLTLVHSILSMVTTYIIILIQHQMAHMTKNTEQQIKNSTTVKSYATGYNGI